ncbi:MAG: hypothetical protein JNG82_03125 [Opitutaceae bacterium]|nr:hypothetical protein [Opitutaceae bacterium]
MLAAEFLPAYGFFLRLIPLSAGAPVATQAELAIETWSPFAVPQVYWGCAVLPGAKVALVYAAARRRFESSAGQKWEKQDVVVPALLPLAGVGSDKPLLRILRSERCLGGFAWDGNTTSPVAVYARGYTGVVTEEVREQFAAQLRVRAGLTDASVEYLTGTPTAGQEGGELRLELRDPQGGVIAASVWEADEADNLDVRDRDFLRARRTRLRHGAVVWRWVLAGGMAAGLAALLELGALAFHRIEQTTRARLAEQAPVVERLETARSLTDRVNDLSARRLRFFEMVEVLNDARPRSIQFTRTDTDGRNIIEIEALTKTPGDVSAYETVLRGLPVLEKVEVRDLRTREGVTTLSLRVAFKAGASFGTGGSP